MISTDHLLDYSLAHSTPVHPVLQELERATHLNTIYPQMIAGPFQGMLLRFISQMIRPDRILEVGAFTGYSTICLADGLRTGGVLHTIEADDELATIFHTYINKAGFQEKVVLHNGDAAEIIPTLEETFDLILLDAGKMDYLLHYELALPKLRPGGFLIADNVLWAGKVAVAATSVAEKSDETTAALRRFNDFVQQDPRVENLLLPVRDGLMLVRKTDTGMQTQ